MKLSPEIFIIGCSSAYDEEFNISNLNIIKNFERSWNLCHLYDINLIQNDNIALNYICSDKSFNLYYNSLLGDFNTDLNNTNKIPFSIFALNNNNYYNITYSIANCLKLMNYCKLKSNCLNYFIENHFNESFTEEDDWFNCWLFDIKVSTYNFVNINWIDIPIIPLDNNYIDFFKSNFKYFDNKDTYYIELYWYCSYIIKIYYNNCKIIPSLLHIPDNDFKDIYLKYLSYKINDIIQFTGHEDFQNSDVRFIKKNSSLYDLFNNNHLKIKSKSSDIIDFNLSNNLINYIKDNILKDLSIIKPFLMDSFNNVLINYYKSILISYDKEMDLNILEDLKSININKNYLIKNLSTKQIFSGKLSGDFILNNEDFINENDSQLSDLENNYYFNTIILKEFNLSLTNNLITSIVPCHYVIFSINNIYYQIKANLCYFQTKKSYKNIFIRIELPKLNLNNKIIKLVYKGILFTYLEEKINNVVYIDNNVNDVINN